MTNPTDRRQIYSGRAMDDLAVIIQIRWLIEHSGYEETEAILAWFDHRVDLPITYAEAGFELGLPTQAEREAMKAKV